MLDLLIFALGAIVLLFGVGFLSFSVVQSWKKTRSTADPGDFIEKIINAFAKLFEVVAKNFPDKTMQVGVILLVTGVILIVCSLFLALTVSAVAVVS